MPQEEIAPGLYVGSEMEDINREIKKEVRLLLDGDKSALSRIRSLTDRKHRLLTPKFIRK